MIKLLIMLMLKGNRFCYRVTVCVTLFFFAKQLGNRSNKKQSR
jgi:hypothetical protein